MGVHNNNHHHQVAEQGLTVGKNGVSKKIKVST
jgi:hypothetical protein